MKNVNHIFSKSPLDQSTLMLKHSELGDIVDSGFYTPWGITDWSRGYFDDSGLEAKNMFLHEICHVIDVYDRQMYERLLKNDYGLTFSGMNLSGYKHEARVITMQHLISKHIFGEATNFHTQPSFTSSFVQRGDGCITVDGWLELTQMYARRTAKKGVEYYYDLWNRACEFIKANRQTA